MPAYKEKGRNTWTVKIKHKNWSGQIKWVTKRGFATKREALQYERDFLARKSGNLDMSFADFVQVYREERGARIKESTLSMKDNIIDTKLIPYFGKKCMREITTKDIMLWQNELLAYRDPKDGNPDLYRDSQSGTFISAYGTSAIVYAFGVIFPPLVEID